MSTRRPEETDTMTLTSTELWRNVWVFTKLLSRNYVEDGCQSSAAALTYQTLFAVVPLLTITFTVLSAFQALSGVGETLQNFVFENVVPEAVTATTTRLGMLRLRACSENSYR